MMVAAKHSVSGLIEKEVETFTPRSDFTTGDDFERSRIGKVLEYRGEFADRLFVTGSVRHDDNDTFHDFTTWRATASLKLPEIGLRPHASVGTGVKYPTLYEQFGFIPGFFVPNPDLKPETSFGWDAGVEFTVIPNRAIARRHLFQHQSREQDRLAGLPLDTHQRSQARRRARASRWPAATRSHRAEPRPRLYLSRRQGCQRPERDAAGATRRQGRRQLRLRCRPRQLQRRRRLQRPQRGQRVPVGLDPMFGFTTFTTERVTLDDYC